MSTKRKTSYILMLFFIVKDITDAVSQACGTCSGGQLVIPAVIKPVLQNEQSIVSTAVKVPQYLPSPPLPISPPIIFEDSDGDGGVNDLLYVLLFALSRNRGGGCGGCGGFGGGGGCGGYGGYNGNYGCGGGSNCGGSCGNYNNGCGCGGSCGNYNNVCGCGGNYGNCGCGYNSDNGNSYGCSCGGYGGCGCNSGYGSNCNYCGSNQGGCSFGGGNDPYIEIDVD